MSELPLSWPVPHGERVLVGVSGGPDSVALLHQLATLGHWPLVACHLDHGWRPQSASDAARVAELAQALGIPWVIRRELVAQTEEAARNARLAFFRETAEAHQAEWVALGHTADDQAETVLMRLIRGTVKGLGGMRRTRAISPTVNLVRPLLDLRRHQTLSYCEAHGLSPVQDPSNQDLRFFRNRVRQELLPLFELENPRFVTHLARQALVWQAESDLLDELAADAWNELVQPDGSISCQALLALPDALKRRLVAAQLAHPSLDAVEAVLRLCRSPQGSGQLPEALRSGDRLWLRQPPQPPRPILEPFRLGSLELPELGWCLTIAESDACVAASPLEICLDADQVRPDAVWRTPRAGDRFRPEGGRGSTPLAKYLGGLGLSQPERARSLVLAQGHTVLWVVGLRRAEEALAIPQSRRIIKVSATRPV